MSRPLGSDTRPEMFFHLIRDQLDLLLVNIKIEKNRFVKEKGYNVHAISKKPELCGGQDLRPDTR